MSLSYVQYVADGTTDEFDVPFAFANRTHVKVTIDGVPPVLPIRWIGEARIKIIDNLTSGSLVELRRETPLSQRLVDFQNGSVLTEEELDLAINQVFFLQQELKDNYDRGLGTALGRVATNNGLITIDPDAVVQELANLVLETEVLANLQQAISDIGLNAESITAQALDITNINAAVDQASTNITSLQTSLGTVDTRVTTLRSDHESLVAIVNALAGGDPGTGLATLIQDETNARIAGDTAITNTVNLIGAKSADGLSFILNLNTTKVSPTETLSQRLSALSATGSNNAAAIITEQDARIAQDTALASDVTSLYARVDTADAAVITERNARISGDNALTTSLNALTARVGTAESDIVSEQSARITGDSALATSLQGLSTRVGDVESAITTEQTARANADSAIASELSLLGAKNAGATAFVIDTAKAQIGGGESLATRFSALATADGDNAAAIQSEQTARISADDALTSSVNSLGTRMGTAEAAIVTEQDARIAGDTAEANARAALAARVTTAESAITSEQTARANGDNALASDLALLGAKNAGGTAWVLDMDKVQVSAGTSLGTRLSGIDTSVGNNAAAIVTEQNARTSADSALASDISTLTTSVNGNTASISTLQSSVNGLSAKYGVSLDVNGYVTGFVQNNNGTSGDFTIIADKFAIVTPGSTPTVPFEVSGGIVRIKEAAIGNLSVSKLSAGTLGAAITQNADWTVGTGKIIWDNGTYMKVSGVGFGTTSQFIEWFGPKMDISLCSEANAIQFLKTDGSAYFGGSLSAGTLKNAAQTTDTGAAASVTVGPFGTNGNPIQVVASYDVTSSSTSNYAATTTGVSQWDSAVANWGGTNNNGTASGTKSISCNVVIRVDRIVNGVTTTGWATLTITSGTEQISGIRPEPVDSATGYLTYTRRVNGTITTTDNAGGTQNRTFTATITDRTSAILATPSSQKVGIVATEQ